MEKDITLFYNPIAYMISYSSVLTFCLIIHFIINLDIFIKKNSVSIPALRNYKVFVGSVAAYLTIDLLWGIFDQYKLPIPLYVITTIYFSIMGFTILTWMRYLVDFLQNKKLLGKLMLYVGNGFFLAEIILLIVNIFTPVLFTIDMETAAYTAYKGRNIMLYVQILLYFLLAVYSVINIVKSDAKFKRRHLTVLFYSAIMGASISVQIYYPYLPLYAAGLLVGSTLLNSFVITDIKDEYKTAFEKSRIEVNERINELSETKLIAYTDPLTGIKNKHAYVEEESRIDRLIGKGEMDEFAIVVFDLNGLKLINDTKGHEAGDEYIIEAVKTIQGFYKEETLYRFGGDEFVLILSGPSYSSRDNMLREFEAHIEETAADETKPVISSGMSIYRKGLDNTYHAVFGRADKNMYARKERLKDRYNR
ncbi:MAG: GGDEF domain-containing protein [Bacilli bacterium]|nr:GGDEF domain-containing protein [Bacilli bacterium]